jgi:thiamine-phosphate pyrophosphorylase
VSAAEEWLEPEEAGCRLLLHLPAGLAACFKADWLEPLLVLDAVAGILVEAGCDPWAAELAARATAYSRACLLLDAIEQVKVVGAHGCHLSDWRQVRAARSRLGPGWIIGASCGESRHAAMVAGEDGADYVLFGTLGGMTCDLERQCELIAWWSELFYLPCAVALGTDPAGMERLIAAGADFLVPALELRGAGPTAPDGIRAMAARLASAPNR